MPTRIQERLSGVLGVSLRNHCSRKGLTNQGMLADLLDFATVAGTHNGLLAVPFVYQPIVCKGQTPIKKVKRAKSSSSFSNGFRITANRRLWLTQSSYFVCGK